MKKITLSILLLLLSTVLTFAQQPVVINGTVDKKTYPKVYLYKVLNGRLSEIATSTPDSSSLFAFKFTPKYKGLYAIGGTEIISLRNIFKFYFKPGDELNLKLQKANYTLEGNNSAENKKLTEWFKTSYTLLDKAVYWTTISSYVDFFPEIEEMYAKLPAYKSSAKTGNAEFDKLFSKIVAFDFTYLAIGYLYTPRSTHPSQEEMSNYYTQFKADDYLTADLLKLPYGDRLLNYLVYKKIDISTKPSIQQQVEAIPVDVVKGQYALSKLTSAVSFSEYEEMFKTFKPYFILEDQKERAQAMAVKLVNTKEGTPALNFSFPDVNNRKVSLSDLKGKVVLIDVWATWCGPCKAEEPHWEKLVKNYKGKDVAFVGISVDQNKKAWDKYTSEKNLNGIQLYAGPGNDLSKAYQINGIPRYLLIDKKGNLITPDSPRPADPKLKSLIDTWLSR
ncbi:TlpA family protein disulfide reductase [Pedobacter sp. HMWF019]|uniref:TlpA family protein disulfide reductase n=1 Tax=Pedobacter sp. HMWF019 TaxID=2056856 RepID=UPI000D3648B4|nr:TlpA disulfide reductase family protein [Pedobacter sp. HMWF019]PTT00298.1 TlpA family protein disulfide reductase [Pedobacter sp. HMWF019]